MPLTKDTIGVGFIGAGDISILHAAAVKKCPGAKLVGLWNRSQDRAKQRAGEFGCKNFATPEELVERPGHRRGLRPHQPRIAPRIHEARARGRQARAGRKAGRRVGRRDRADERPGERQETRLHAGAQLHLRAGHDPHARTRRERRPRQDRLRVCDVQHPPPRRSRGALPRRRAANPHAPLVHPPLPRRQAGRTLRDEGDAALQGVQGRRHRDGADATRQRRARALLRQLRGRRPRRRPVDRHGQGDRHRRQHALQLPRSRRDQAGPRPQPDVHRVSGFDHERSAALPDRLPAHGRRSRSARSTTPSRRRR